ncbi:sigma-54-dependent Fis family transcriptional regulator [candidate division WOR-3 bacterium]|nr:sigma-54-dependent Fis family transcriptional regulator [candidate division WOR-3 bacterium]
MSGFDKIKVLLVDDDSRFLKLACERLSAKGCEVIVAVHSAEALEHMETRFFDVVVSDIKMPGMDGIELLRKLSQERPTQQVIIISGHATPQDAVDAMKLGAFDFLIKPFAPDELFQAIRRAARQGNLARQNIALEEELVRTKGIGEIIGESDAIRDLHAFVKRASSSEMPVLVTGESGTGKELVVQAIHAASVRSSRPLVVVDGSTLRAELLVSELFGHEKGAFTGAATKKPGLFEVADGGTIFLDEIGELSAENQGALLRVLESGTYRPVGAVREVHTDVRIVAATNRDIKQIIKSGAFREDLYYRLKGLSVDIPPLRKRSQDIELLAAHFLALCNKASSTEVKLTPAAISALVNYSWPGNVRELKHVIGLAALIAGEDGADIQPRHLPAEVSEGESSPVCGWSIDLCDGDLPLNDFKDHCERVYISRLLEQHKGNKAKVGRVLGISPSVLYPKLRKLGLTEEDSDI